MQRTWPKILARWGKNAAEVLAAWNRISRQDMGYVLLVIWYMQSNEHMHIFLLCVLHLCEQFLLTSFPPCFALTHRFAAEVLAAWNRVSRQGVWHVLLITWHIRSNEHMHAFLLCVLHLCEQFLLTSFSPCFTLIHRFAVEVLAVLFFNARQTSRQISYRNKPNDLRCRNNKMTMGTWVRGVT